MLGDDTQVPHSLPFSSASVRLPASSVKLEEKLEKYASAAQVMREGPSAGFALRCVDSDQASCHASSGGFKCLILCAWSENVPCLTWVKRNHGVQC